MLTKFRKSGPQTKKYILKGVDPLKVALAPSSKISISKTSTKYAINFL